MISERKGIQFDESQYEILIKCSGKGDLTQWNEWRENNQKVSILLEGAKFIAAIGDRQTFIWGCDFNKQTVFTGKGLYLAKIEPRLKESLKINPT